MPRQISLYDGDKLVIARNKTAVNDTLPNPPSTHEKAKVVNDPTKSAPLSPPRPNSGTLRLTEPLTWRVVLTVTLIYVPIGVVVCYFMYSSPYPGPYVGFLMTSFGPVLLGCIAIMWIGFAQQTRLLSSRVERTKTETEKEP
jgi:hypothetical protein